MKLKMLVHKYKGDLDRLDRMGFNDFEVPEKIVQFIDALSKKTLLSQEDFIFFDSYCKSEEAVSEFLVEIAYSIFEKIYCEDYQKEIKTAVATIESALKTSQPIPQAAKNKPYHALINSYLFFILVAHNGDTNFQNKIIFGLNALRLTGRLAREGELASLDLSKPFYPVHLTRMMQNQVALSPGLKDADTYFPFKYVSKIHQGDSGDNTFLATNGEKLLFMRGVQNYAPAGVFASKIAKLISAQHFSSERLLTNGVVGARGLPGYAVSVVDNSVRMTRKKQIEQEKRVYSGSGIIDEVCNFVVETDPNAENFGFSTTQVLDEVCYLSKIDFDRCYIGSKVTKENYDRNILTGFIGGIYHAASHVQTDPGYIYEKLYTRMKLCLIPDDLLAQLADRSYLPEDAVQKKQAFEAVLNRKKIALELFFEHPQVSAFLQENPEILHQCFLEITDYIHQHYRDEEQNRYLQSALKDSLTEMQQAVWQRLQIRLAAEPMQEEKVGVVDVAEKPNDSTTPKKPESTVVLLSQLKPEAAHQKSIVAETKSTPKKILVREPEQEGFLSRHWGKILTVVIFALIGVGVGAALTATGVLAPFGAGVLGYTFGCLSGLASGLILGGVTLGAEAVFDCCTPDLEEEFYEGIMPNPIKSFSPIDLSKAYTKYTPFEPTHFDEHTMDLPRL